MALNLSIITMADVWYEPKPDVKPQNAFSFDECIGLMVDTVQVRITDIALVV